MNSLLIRSILVWLGLFVLAFVNGALRELGLKKFIGMGEPLAHQLSCVTGVILWTIFAWMVWDLLKISTVKQAIGVGIFWFVATVLAETFVINRKLTWPQIIHTYNVAAGEFWGLVLLWIGVMPVLIYMCRKK